MQSLLQAAWVVGLKGERSRLASVVDVEGSAFRSPGARMLILPGRTIGTISGGCLEAEVAERALALGAGELPAVWRYDTRQEDEELLGWGSGCGGAITLLIEEIGFENAQVLSENPLPLPASPAAEALGFIDTCHTTGKLGVLATVFRSSDPALARVGDRIDTQSGESASPLHRRISADARRVSAARRWMVARYVIGSAEVQVLLEPISPPMRLLICGIGEEALALARLARQMGWHTTLADPRLDPAQPPAAADRVLDCAPAEVLAAAQMPGEFAAVIMTHRLLQDAELLAALLPSPARYIGALGPRRRLQLLLDRIGSPVLSPDQLDRLHGPAGLDIGGETPGEIALSIAAEIAAVFADRPGGMLRHRRGGIHPGLANRPSRSEHAASRGRISARTPARKSGKASSPVAR